MGRTHIYTLFVVLIGWVLFRAEGLSGCIKVIKAMFVPFMTDIAIQQMGIYLESYGIYLGLGILLSMPIFPRIREIINTKFGKNTFVYILYYLFVIGVFVLSVMFLSQATYNPFIYFRF